MCDFQQLSLIEKPAAGIEYRPHLLLYSLIGKITVRPYR